MATIIAPRSCQIEAYNLDRSFETIIDQLVERLKLPLLSDEVKLLFKGYVAYSYLKSATTIGMSSYKMKICDKDDNYSLSPSSNKIKLALLGACNIMIPYLNNKDDWKNKIEKSLYQSLKLSWLNSDYLNSMLKIINLLVFGLFLKSGQHLLIQDKILNLTTGIDITDAANSGPINKCQMEFMNREAIWRITAEFFTTIVPLVNLNRVKEFMTRPFKTHISSVDLSSRMFHSDSKEVCAICKSQPFNPFIIGCTHIFCYYCIQTRHLTSSDGVYSCAKCNYQTNNGDQVIRYRIHNALLKDLIR